MSRPFEGVRIVDTTHVLAGPFCTYQLALLGAEVIRVENPDPARADMTRTQGPVPALNEQGIGASFLGQNANKRSIALDLKHPAAKDILGRLIAAADVMVENFRPGVMERLGFGFEAACQLNPKIIYASLTGYGQEGPMAHAPVYDHVMQAVSGLMNLVGGDAEPQRVKFPLIDYAAGLSGAFAISSALYQRTHSDRPQRVDISMLDAALTLMTANVAQVLTTGQVVRPQGNVAASGSPFSGFFDTRDGMLAVTANTYEQAVKLCTHLGRTDLLEDRRLRDWGKHTELGEELTPLFAAIYATKTAADWEVELNAAGVPAGRARSLPEILDDPQTKGRDSVLSAGQFAPLGRELEVPGVGFTLAHGGARVRSAPPRLGEHTDEILDELGIEAATRQGLRAQGAIA